MSPTRRQFLASTGVAAIATGIPTAMSQPPNNARSQPIVPGKPSAGPARDAADRGSAHRGPCLIASANGVRSVQHAAELHTAGSPLLDAIVKGVAIVEDDPNDMSVGYGGLPNEDGIVELDASVMDGRLHRAGSVAALRNIKNPAAVALMVLRKTDHVMIVGEGALRFARAMGFAEQDLLTPQAREAWLKWKANLNPGDKWLDEDQQPRPGRPEGGGGEKPGRPGASATPRASSPHAMIDDAAGLAPGRGAGSGPGPVLPDSPIPFTTGTVHVSGVGPAGEMAACTSTSGLSYKLAGRVGDSPIIGAGMYCDQAVGSAGATGRGEAVMQVCGSFSIVQQMEAGLTPTDACLAVLKRIAERTREKRLLDAQGRPSFNVTMYAVRKDGAFGSAAMWSGSSFAVHDGKEAVTLPSAWVFQKE